MNIKPIGRRILVEVNKETRTASGIILSERDQQKDETPFKCKVLAVSEEVNEVKVGETVIIPKYSGITVERLSDTLSYRMIDMKEVLVVIEN